MSDREKRLEEIKRIISDHSAQLSEGCAERLSVQFANMMADDAWEDNDELPSLVALTAFLQMLIATKAMPGIGSNGRGSITAFYRDGDIKHTIDFLPSGDFSYHPQKGDSHEDRPWRLSDQHQTLLRLMLEEPTPKVSAAFKEQLAAYVKGDSHE